MGLDVYLYYYENMEDTLAREKQYEEESEEIWQREIAAYGCEKYEDLTSDQTDSIRKKTVALAKSLGLDSDGGDIRWAKEKIEHDSLIHPTNYFKIGYFRSSYNPSGINHILRNTIGSDLYTIFEAGDEYRFQPDWKASLARAHKILTDFKKFASNNGSLGVELVRHNEFLSDNPIKTEKEALELFIKTRQEHQKSSLRHPDFSSFSNRDGEFILGAEPLKVRAIIPGATKRLLSAESAPCVFLIYERENNYDSYIEALEIVEETIQWVLAQKEPNKYYLHWSG